MTAERTKQVKPTPFALQLVDAVVAHHLVAKGALIRDSGPGMARTNQGTIFEHDRRRRLRDVKLGNGDGQIRGLDPEFDIAQAECLTDLQKRLPYGPAFDESAVG